MAAEVPGTFADAEQPQMAFQLVDQPGIETATVVFDDSQHRAVSSFDKDAGSLGLRVAHDIRQRFLPDTEACNQQLSLSLFARS